MKCIPIAFYTIFQLTIKIYVSDTDCEIEKSYCSRLPLGECLTPAVSINNSKSFGFVLK